MIKRILLSGYLGKFLALAYIALTVGVAYLCLPSSLPMLSEHQIQSEYEVQESFGDSALRPEHLESFLADRLFRLGSDGLSPIAPPSTVEVSLYQYKRHEECTCSQEPQPSGMSSQCIQERYNIKCQSRHPELVSEAEISPTSNLTLVSADALNADAAMLRWMTYNSQHEELYSCKLTLSFAGNQYQRLEPRYKFETSSVLLNTKILDMLLKIHAGLLLVAILTSLRTALQVVTEIANSSLLYFELAQLTCVIAAIVFAIKCKLDLVEIPEDGIHDYLATQPYKDLSTAQQAVVNFRICAMLVFFGTPFRLVYWIGVQYPNG